MPEIKLNKAIFLDMDGTISKDNKEIYLSHLDKKVKGYVHKIADWELLPNAEPALKLMSSLDFKLIIITSQSGIGRGYYTENDFHILYQHINNKLQEQGVKISGTYFCPHHPEKAIGRYKIICNCRKPKTGMIDQAVKDHEIDLKKSYVIGDKTVDIAMGKNAGCKTILVQTGKAGKDGEYKVMPNYTGSDLLIAAQIIFREQRECQGKIK